MHAWCSGRDVTFGEQCLIDEVTHFSVWSDYWSQSEASTSPTLSLSGSPICLTEFGVKTTGTERKGGGGYVLEYCHYFNIRYLCLKWRALIYRAELLSGGWTRHVFSIHASDGTIREGQWYGPIYLSLAERCFCLIMTVMNALTSAIWYICPDFQFWRQENHAIWN